MDTIQEAIEFLSLMEEPEYVSEIVALRARVAELERERDQLALSLSAARAERDHAVRSAELLEDELHNEQAARRDFEHAWLEGRAIMAVAGYFSRMRGPDAYETRWAGKGGPYAWGTGFLHKVYPDRVAKGTEIRALYAGSAPVPAVPQAVDVDAICNAYESGVGHRGRPTANVNPYREGTPEHEAYAIGAKDAPAHQGAK